MSTTNTLHPSTPRLVTMSDEDAMDLIESLRTSLAQRPLDPQDEDYAAQVGQFAADVAALGRFARAYATYYAADDAIDALKGQAPATFVGPQDYTPEDLGIPTDQGYAGIARGYLRAVNAVELPAVPSAENRGQWWDIYNLALGLAASTIDAWRAVDQPARR